MTKCSGMFTWTMIIIIVVVVFIVAVISLKKSEQDLRNDIKVYQETTQGQIEQLQIDVEKLKAEAR